MSKWRLPTTVCVNGKSLAIRSDFRAVIDAISAISDTELEESERVIAFLQIMFPRWNELNAEELNEAAKEAMRFINLGKLENGANAPKKPAIVNWERDVSLIAPAVDKVLGFSCRRCDYLHWWEFIGAYNNIGKCFFAEIVSIRYKKANGKPLEKYEEEFARENAELCMLESSIATTEEEEFFKRLGV